MALPRPMQLHSSSSLLKPGPTPPPPPPPSVSLPRIPLPHQLKEKILCLEIMGVDAGKALSQNPGLRSATLGSLDAVLTFLRAKAGLLPSDLPKVLGMCPTILTSDVALHLTPALRFLTSDLGVPSHRLRRVLTKNPRLLASSAADQLRPALFFLQRLGLSDLDALAYHDSVLLVSSVENTLLPKLRYLQALGMTAEEAAAMVRRCPALLTFSVENNFRPKYEYLVGEMGRGLGEVKEFPQYFTFSLEKRIKPRHCEAAKRGGGLRNSIALPLPLMLKSTDHEFRLLLDQ